LALTQVGESLMHTLFSHTMSALQATPHPPQWLSSVVVLVSHPFAGLLSQSAKPASHESIPHTPFMHAGVPLGTAGQFRGWCPLSIWPLQSLSTPSQTSAEGCTFWLHTSMPFEHAVVPAAQTPSLPVLQGWPPRLPSSVWPLQSLSRLSHTSGDGCTFWLQTI